MRTNVGILVCLVLCSQVWCGKLSPVNSEETDDKIEEVVKLLTARGGHNNDDDLGGEHGVRIVGGRAASPGEYPWMVSLYEDGRFFCGGSILNERTILTAAHCVEYTPPWASVWVRAGDYAMRRRDDTEQRRKVKTIKMHAKYNTRKITNDIAILKLTSDLEFNDFVQPIKIPTLWKERNVAGLNNCKLSGFGQYREPAVKFPWVLQEADSTLKSQSYCKNTVAEKFAPLPFSTKLQICTYDNGFGACPGDSGGPYVCYDANDVPYQLGVVSWGSLWCAEGFNVYTRVAKFTKWINRNS